MIKKRYHVIRQIRPAEHVDHHATLENHSFFSIEKAYDMVSTLIGNSVSGIAECSIKGTDTEGVIVYRVSTPEVDDLFIIKMWGE